VFNQVTVTLENQEAGDLTSKEVEVAKFLDTIHSINLEEIYLRNLIEPSGVDLSIDRIRNNQTQRTHIVEGKEPLFLV